MSGSMGSAGSVPSVTPLPDAEVARLRRLDTVVWNYLALRDPDDVERWIVGARAALCAVNATPALEAAFKRLGFVVDRR